jgi:hypothetical protein
MRRHRSTALVLASALVAAVPAFAADPGEGTVSKAAPKVAWTGQSVNGGATTIPAVANSGAPACVSPSCDTFNLTVADSADLTVTADAPDTGGFLMIQIVKPDGETVYSSGAEGETGNKVRIKKAPTGAYEVQIAANALNPVDYSASAELAVAAAPAPAGTPAPAPQPAPGGEQPAPAPAPATEPSASLGLKTRSLSAKRARKAPKLVITSDRAVTDVTAQIRKGAKVLGTAKLATLNGTATVKVKLRKAIKRGKYAVVLGAKQGTRTVGLTAKLTVKR